LPIASATERADFKNDFHDWEFPFLCDALFAALFVGIPCPLCPLFVPMPCEDVKGVAAGCADLVAHAFASEIFQVTRGCFLDGLAITATVRQQELFE